MGEPGDADAHAASALPGATAVAAPVSTVTSPRRRRFEPLALLAAWLASRALLLGFLTGVVPYPDGPRLLDDVRLYAEWSNLLVTGRFPVGDDMWQYPPGAGVVFALAAHIGDSPLTGFLVIALVADLATLGALAVAGVRRRRGFTAAWAWIGAGLLIGPVLLARFDVIPTLAAVVALLLLARPALSGVAAAIGALLKVWPVFMLLALRRDRLPAGVLGFIGTAVVIVAVVAVWASGGVSFLGEQQARGLQVESVGAWPFMLVQAFGVEIPQEFRFGSMEIDIAATIPIGLVITLLGFAVIGLIGLARLLGRIDHLPGADTALAVLLVSVVTSRVLSPQYSVWIAGVAAVTLLDPRSSMRTVRWLLAVSIAVTQVVYPFAYGSFLTGEPWAVALQTIRITTLVAATVLALAPIARTAISGGPKQPREIPVAGG